MRAFILALFIASCTASDESPAPDAGHPDAGCDPSDRACGQVKPCAEWRAATEPVTAPAEIALAGTPTVADDQNQYVCSYDMPGASDITWTDQVRRQTGPNASLQVGAIVYADTTGAMCAWQPALLTRETRIGACDP